MRNIVRKSAHGQNPDVGLFSIFFCFGLGFTKLCLAPSTLEIVMIVAVMDISFWQLRGPQRSPTKPRHVCGCIGAHQTVKRGGSRRVPRTGRGYTLM